MKTGFWKQQSVGFIALAGALIAIGFHFYQRAPRIGFVETAVLMSEFNEAIKAKAEFEKSQKEWDANVKRINDSLSAAMNVMKAGYDKASPKDREAMGQNLSKWNQDMQRYAQAVKRMSEEKEKELMTPVINKMNSFLKEWGEKHGYDMILGATSAGNILQAKSTLNMTSTILRDMNAYYKDMGLSLPSPRNPDSGDIKKNEPQKSGNQK